MKNTITLIFLFVIGISSAFAQFDFVKKGKFAALAGYNYNRRHWAEVGLVRGYRLNYEHYDNRGAMSGAEFYYEYAFISSEFLIGDRFIMCPKIGYHIVLLVFDVGVQLIDYTDFHTHKFGIQPEAGISMGGLGGVYYRYSITTNNDAFGISNHNVGLKIIIGSGLSVDDEWRRKHNKQ